jgi:glucokinase
VKPCVVALDVGGTSMKAAVVDEELAVLASRRHPTGREIGPDAVLDRIFDAVQASLETARVHGVSVEAVGVVVPGIVDDAKGTAVLSANLGWRDVPLRALLSDRVGLPIGFGHDVRAGGIAESVVGAGRALGDFLFLAIGTGIAGAVMIDGEPYAQHGYAGELGHMVIDVNGLVCRCGGHGCLETVASAVAIAARYTARTGEEVEALDVCRRVEAGEVVAHEVWGEAVEALGAALAAYVGILAPAAVVVGGGLAEAGATLLDPLGAALDRRLTFQPRPRLLRAALGESAGALGAAVLAWRTARL